MRLKIGEIGVDAGLCWVGDPCYIIGKGDNNYEEIGNTWDEFLKRFWDRFNGNYASFDGLGVCVGSGYGDGLYPVYADVEDGVVRSVTVEFISREGDEE